MFAKYFNPNIVANKQAFKRIEDYNIVLFLSDMWNVLNFANHFAFLLWPSTIIYLLEPSGKSVFSTDTVLHFQFPETERMA